MAVRTKGIYESPSSDDGLRVLASQYWPRGVRREKADRYICVLGPSRETLHAFKSGAIDWDEYARRYLEEIQNDEAQQALQELTAVAAEGTVTLMCICRDEAHCHRRLLKDLIEHRLSQ